MSGKYTPIAVIDYDPETNYGATDVLAQSIDVTFDSALGATSLWYSTKTVVATLQLHNYFPMSATNSPDDSTKSVLSAAMSGGVLPAGKFLLIAESLVEEQPPSAAIGSFSAKAAGAGALDIQWQLSGTPVDGDEIFVTITDEDGNSVEIEKGRLDVSYLHPGSSTTHGMSYDIVVEVCNGDGLCSTPVGEGTVVADKEVTGATAIGVTVTTDYENKKYTLNWIVEGDLADVKEWIVCHARTAFDDVDMPSNCVSTDGDNTALTADIAMSIDAKTGELSRNLHEVLRRRACGQCRQHLLRWMERTLRTTKMHLWMLTTTTPIVTTLRVANYQAGPGELLAALSL